MQRNQAFVKCLYISLTALLTNYNTQNFYLFLQTNCNGDGGSLFPLGNLETARLLPIYSKQLYKQYSKKKKVTVTPVWHWSAHLFPVKSSILDSNESDTLYFIQHTVHQYIGTFFSALGSYGISIPSFQSLWHCLLYYIRSIDYGIGHHSHVTYPFKGTCF